jgi:hypothetical protein
MGETAPADSYANQKANIRDTVKYLATAYAACGTVIFAGASLSGLGGLPSGQLVVAIGAGAAALVCVLAGLKWVSDMLISDFCFPSTLDSSARSFLDTHHQDLLPSGVSRYEELLAKYGEAVNAVTQRQNAWRDLPPLPSPNDPNYGTAQANEKRIKDEYDQAIAASVTWRGLLSQAVSAAHLYLLQERLKRLRERLLALSLIGVVAFGIAVYAVTKKPGANDPNCQIFAVATPAR